MSTTVTTFKEFYDIYKNEVIGNTSELTDFSEGSLHDIIDGAMGTGLNEVSELLISEFRKTFFGLAEGADLEYLAVDHFGDTFARPLAVSATGAILFSRPNTNAGNVVIPTGTIIKTKKDANGLEIRFATTEQVTMTGLTISALISAVIPGKAGNIIANKIIVLESSLTDPNITVNNPLATAGGIETLTDPEYREFIGNKILALAGATEAAVKGAAKAVPGVFNVALVTRERAVIDYDIDDEIILAGATYFRIPYPIVYISDANGNSSPALISAVKAALEPVRACGVRIEVLGATAISINWSASITLNISGPNYAELSVDPSKIIASMTEYINSILSVGDGFFRSSANNYILSIWGPLGTNDITAFTTSVPSGNVSVTANQKAVSGTIQII